MAFSNKHTGKRKWLSLPRFYFVVGVFSIPITAMVPSLNSLSTGSFFFSYVKAFQKFILIIAIIAKDSINQILF